MVQQQVTSTAKVESENHKKIMTLGFALLCNALVMAISFAAPTCFLASVGLIATNIELDPNFTVKSPTQLVIGVSMLVFGLISLVQVICSSMSYPEWPINRLLVNRVHRKLETRAKRLVDPRDMDVHVFEVVPRENWTKLKLETASDIVLLKIAGDQILMEGDCFRYRIPAAAIMNCQIEVMRPPGWFVDHFFVMLTLRTPNGPRECPLSKRDFKLGQLRSNYRRKTTQEFVDKIHAIAEDYYDTTFSFDSYETGGEEDDVVAANVVDPTNPYAAPSHPDLNG